MKRRRLQITDYTVGWICALPIELAAAQEMLDDEHDEPPYDNHQDSNIYTLGRIGNHNIVIVCLPSGQIGNNCAAVIATQMKARFTSIRFGLMVGIGGGVPSNAADIRLGDVVISQPERQHGGVVQYDSGKSTPSGFERTGALNAPPTVLLNVVSILRANSLRGRSGVSKQLGLLASSSTFNRNNVEPDLLFEASYNHVQGEKCNMCSLKRRIHREPRCSNQPVVHFGTVASGNRVMRDGLTRDSVSKELGGVLCFEMEAAGLMNSFPCLVIRGICDYADSHKNKSWQPYAAATAAACARDILLITPTSDQARLKEPRMIQERQRRLINNLDDNMADMFISMLSSTDQYKRFFSIQPVDPEDSMFYWVFRNIDFQNWASGHGSQSLWVTGPMETPFRGISQRLAMQILPAPEQRSYGLYFSCTENTSFRTLVRDLIYQVIQAISSERLLLVQRVLKSLIESYWQGLRLEKPDSPYDQTYFLPNESLEDIIQKMTRLPDMHLIRALKRLIQNETHFQLIAVDGLENVREDQCPFAQSLHLLNELLLGPEQPRKIILDETTQAISSYARSFLDDLEMTRVYGKAMEYILDQAQGVFLWVKLVGEELLASQESGCSQEEVLEFLRSLPTELEDFYKHMFTKMKMKKREARDTINLFSLVLYGHRLLTVDEMLHALSIVESTEKQFVPSNDYIEKHLPTERRIWFCGGNFLETTEQDGNEVVQVMHQTVREFFLTPEGNVANSDLIISQKEAHFRIATTCLRYLMLCSPGPEEIIDFPDVNLWTTEHYLCFARYLEDRPFALYALCHLGDHMTACPRKEDLEELIWSFVSSLQHKSACYLFGSWANLNLNISGKDISGKDDGGQAEYFRDETLLVAARHGLLNAVSVLILAGATKNIADDEGKTPLSWAALKGHLRVVKFLVGWPGVDVNVQDGGGRTPYFLAKKVGHEDIVKLLLNTGSVDTRVGITY
ncbi:purine and uridine phosphorylase [Fusarium beomiforme]|uniref:Purine and uridine phosphorylase n=1 Tax=Fusarium beomiforme TaxID=44412 RepID=A0A9P5DY20_9HYPO|nr:purine and uridine phosphorylase [Fusarium beomiforme]